MERQTESDALDQMLIKDSSLYILFFLHFITKTNTNNSVLCSKFMSSAEES